MRCVAVACFCLSSDNCAVVRLAEQRCRRDGMGQVQHTNRRRRKVNESLQRAVRGCALQGCVMMMMMLGCSGAVVLPLPLSLSLSLTLSLSRSVISRHSSSCLSKRFHHPRLSLAHPSIAAPPLPQPPPSPLPKYCCVLRDTGS